MITKVYAKQTLEEFLNRINIENEEVCWIPPVVTNYVLYKGNPTYLIKAILDHFGKEYNGKVTRTCKNSRCINPYHLWSPTSEERFWSNVFIGEKDECWEWKAYSGTSQYGYTKILGMDEVVTHRIAYLLTHGDIPEGMLICHHCDNPPCCNPNHLFAGTHQDNIDDREAKGRNWMPRCKGEEHGNNKLTREEVLEIRYLYEHENHSYYTLGEKYNCSPFNIRKIIKRQTWSWL